MKKVLGLDIGTNSVGWAVVNQNDKGEFLSIEKIGSRIIPMSQDVMDKFGAGQTESSTAQRTQYRGVRRLRERSLLRRERLHRVLHILHFLPQHYDAAIGWNKKENKTYGKFLPGVEVNIPWVATDQGHQFIFMDSYAEMLKDLKQHQPHLFEKSSTPVPLDWTIYYLRKKALTQAISKEELAWILLNFNQKRGYYQLRGEEVEDNTKREEFYALKVVKVELDKDNTSAKTWYKVHLENGFIYPCPSDTPIDSWVGMVKDFIVTTTLEKDGSEKRTADGEIKRSFRAPKEDDWTLLKKKTESELEKSGKQVGAFIYDTLLSNPDQKIIGGLIKTIERKYYKKELEQILETQQKFIAELSDKKLFQACAEELYPLNDSHRENLLERDFKHLFVQDIIFYHRPLKTKKSLISNCTYEYRTFYKNGEKQISPIKCIAKSNPLFQEFRVWQFVQNLRILQRQRSEGDSIKYNVDVTAEFLKDENDIANLFTWLNERKVIKQDQLLKSYFKLKVNKETKELDYRWNYVDDKNKEYPCNATRTHILSFLEKCKEEKRIEDDRFVYSLWHLLYSVVEPIELRGALAKFAEREHLHPSFVDVFAQFPPLEKEYGSYSEKAIKRLLPLMRMGDYWHEDKIDVKTKQRIQRIIDGEADDDITHRSREKVENLRSITDFKGLPLWKAGYVVYNRHSESGELTKWKTPHELSNYIQNEFKQYSLRNPIVEQIVLETLRVVHDLWVKHGDFSEIHLELGRDIKNSSDKRKRMAERQQENENSRQRVLEMLIDLKKEAAFADLNPYSPSQQEKLRIVEDGVLRSNIEIPKDIEKITKSAKPTSRELTKYRLWLDQKYRSPYTGQPISLAQLFTSKYEIEHVIPQAKYFDDSFTNKVICESEVNKEKGSMLAHEFILKNGGSTVNVGGRQVQVLKNDAYVELINRLYGKNNPVKAKKLLAEDIDEVVGDFSERQLNDTRYISRVVQKLLSNIVREEDEQESTSKHVIGCSGQVTTALKKDWGLNDIWNKIIQPRFERLNEMTATEDYGVWQSPNHFQIRVPEEIQKGFTKKRIDHRHHAMDALVIACATRSHINYISNRSGQDRNAKFETTRTDLRSKLCYKENSSGNNYNYIFNKPWDTFTQDAHRALENIVVSHKQNLRVLTKTNNYTQFINKDGKKDLQKQVKGDHFAVRKPMHQETIYGRVSIRSIKEVALKKALENWKQIVDRTLKDKIRELIGAYGKYDAQTILKYFKDRDYKFNNLKINRVEVYEYDHNCAAVRKSIGDDLTIKQIERITDESIRKILMNHLSNYDDNLKEAFSPEGLMEMNKNIKELNGGKNHQPIYKVRLFEDLGSKFPLGVSHNNPDKYAIAAKGTNLFFGIYEDQEGKRAFDSIPLNIVIDRLKEKKSPVPETYNESKLKFHLSPNDLVYVPTDEEQKQPELVDVAHLSDEQKGRVYKMVSCTGVECHFLPNTVASVILQGKEFTSINKTEKTIEGISIKRNCWKLKVNRLGEITDVKR